MKFTEEVSKIALSAIDYKRIQSIDSIETHPYGKSKDLVCKKEITCSNIIKQYMIKFDDITKEHLKKHNPN